MPIYEYRCTRCDERFEELVRIDTPDDDVECPRCGGRHARRRLSTFATSGAGARAAGAATGCGGASGFS